MTTRRYTAAKNALSFLRAAQVNQGGVEDSDLAQAFHSLKRYTEGIERAEREAEDAVVVEFMTGRYRAEHGPYHRNLSEMWHEYTEHERNRERRAYHAARKFFEERP